MADLTIFVQTGVEGTVCKDTLGIPRWPGRSLSPMRKMGQSWCYHLTGPL